MFPILVLRCECSSRLLSSFQQTFLVCWMMKPHILQFAWNILATWRWRRRTPRDWNRWYKNPPALSALLHFSCCIKHRSDIVTTVPLPASPNATALSTLLDTVGFVNNCYLSRRNKFAHGVCSLQAMLYPKEIQGLLRCTLLCKKEWICLAVYMHIPISVYTVTGLGHGLRSWDKHQREWHLG